MPSSKGKPTDPKLREKVVQDVKNETNKDGGGKGQMAAWKGAKIAKEYEKKGGGYENETGSKNEPKKGTPQPKSSGKKKTEGKEPESESESPSPEEENEGKEETAVRAEKPKANTGAKKTGPKSAAKSGQAKKEGTLKGKGKEKTEGTRKSARVAGKRKTYADDDEDEDSSSKKKKTTKS